LEDASLYLVEILRSNSVTQSNVYSTKQASVTGVCLLSLLIRMRGRHCQ